MDKKRIPAGEFKQRCLAILDRVAETHEEVVITKRGKPVARVAPIAPSAEREAELLAALRGRGRMTVTEAELLAPSGEDAPWAAESD
jgi:prevent-host-death family protein